MLSVFIAVFIILGIAFLWKRQKDNTESLTTIPGPKKGSKFTYDEKDLTDQFLTLKKLHEDYGPIASFWKDDKMRVSIASPELLKETRNLSDVPAEISEPFRDLFTDDAITFQDVEESIKRRKLYDPFFIMKACKTHFTIIKEEADAMASKWVNNTEADRFPWQDTVKTPVQKAMLRITFGETFADNEKLNSFRHEFKVLNDNMLTITKLKPDSPEYKAYHAAVRKLRSIVKQAFEDRRLELEEGSDKDIFIDLLLDESIPEGQRNADGFAFFTGSDTVNFFQIWIFHHICTNPEIQEKIYEELKSVLGDESVTLENYSKLIYLRQVVDESLRYYVKFHTGRISEKEMIVGGHVIPKGTIIYQHIGQCHHDPNIWKNPDEFDPDRFTRENCKGRHAFAFKPFGFAGRRICPGMSVAYMVMITMIATWLHKYKIALVPGQTLEIIEGPFPIPKQDLQITIIPRK